jgi:tetratricopeptide (TPR) repeat protein
MPMVNGTPVSFNDVIGDVCGDDSYVSLTAKANNALEVRNVGSCSYLKSDISKQVYDAVRKYRKEKLSLYDDKGDTASLKAAAKNLESCKTEGLWDALRNYEIGYVLLEMGHEVKGAMQTRSAAKLFEESSALEAQAFYAVYAYFVDDSFGWLPFKSDNRDAYLKTLNEASLKSKRFWPLFLTPLIWIYYDRKDFQKGLELAELGLKKAPNHPIMFQIKADMLYRLKRYGEAAAAYEKSAADYLSRTGKSIRYWCSVLNLIRIYHDAGNEAKANEQRNKLKDAEYEKLEKWMPSSLMDDLKDRNLI